jgi:hypothetical protein
VDLTFDIVKRIAARCENFIGLKDSTGRLGDMPELVAIGVERPFAVFIGGAKVLENYPIGPLGGVAFNLSHAGDLALIAMSQRPDALREVDRILDTGKTEPIPLIVTVLQAEKLAALKDFTAARHGATNVTPGIQFPTVDNSVSGCLFIGGGVLVGIIREDHPIAPSRDDSLEAHDELLFLATPEVEDALEAMLSPGKQRVPRGKE